MFDPVCRFHVSCTGELVAQLGMRNTAGCCGGPRVVVGAFEEVKDSVRKKETTTKKRKKEESSNVRPAKKQTQHELPSRPRKTTASTIEFVEEDGSSSVQSFEPPSRIDFMDGQIWAAFDEYDVPNEYGVITQVMEDGVQVTWLEVDKEDPTKYRKGESSTDPVPFNCWSHLMNGRYFEDECIYITPHIGDNRSA